MDKKTIVIAGAGPAGLTCAIYLARAGHEVTVYSDEERSMSCLDEATVIENYPGFPDGILGSDLLAAMRAQAEKSGAEILPQGIDRIDAGRMICVDTDGNEAPYGEFVMAVGVTHRKFECPGSDQAPIHTCAVCDGGMYTKDDMLAVIGGGDTAIGDALYLAGIVKKVHVIVRRDVLRATNRTACDRLARTENVEMLKSSSVTRIEKDLDQPGKRQSYTLEINGGKAMIRVNGIFACIGFTANYIPGFAEGLLDANGNVRDDRHVWRIGDCRPNAQRQAVIAAADGAETALKIIGKLNGN